MWSHSHQATLNQLFVHTKPLYTGLTAATSALEGPAVFLPFPRPFWLNNSGEGRSAPQVAPLSPALSHAVLRTGTDVSHVTEVWAPALRRSAAICPADFINQLVDNNSSLNPLGKCMEWCKSLMITITPVTASANTHEHAEAFVVRLGAAASKPSRPWSGAVAMLWGR